jgi:hypothetical protein
MLSAINRPRRRLFLLPIRNLAMDNITIFFLSKSIKSINFHFRKFKNIDRESKDAPLFNMFLNSPLQFIMNDYL